MILNLVSLKKKVNTFGSQTKIKMNVFKISNSERKVSKKIYINIMGKEKNEFLYFFFLF